ncbi:MAG: DNA-directed RNA polymerase subunit omega [Zetaproteobacteria bacterium CG_4_9_14_3_um_filter_49_83]|nr:MAG: DNA-directed RNA polymerase subunit omega [Zetaproteobacteria bacterium CG1_02_49_23]PIQ34890.1 MAG: DNA-directed RNA polymerase subunit omega [Zetaproteobacteria bacterium CG17_big_fil_post_rev_8_21_14_2_50_50_13]PIV30141.1 MAG: DNA-directed RNA polymerase subunit omega [Zetaproteobacteria bacterium CG02_land_8_20_14_3_00_50_9]PIY55436.1 MAG: DNA-directed RNA polymerase subunit omega [Zetaproteobacteria bacterium CG_4_10_14_0_8_um_filter_49_80]PJA35175.1 MAG: DNA-directed RNA polymeras
MARVTVEDCVRYYPNRFEMVVLAAKRARQVLNGMPLLLEDEGHKPTVQALREMGEGLVSWETLAQVDEQMRQHQRAVEDGVA